MKSKFSNKINDYLPLIVAGIFAINVISFIGVQLSGFFMIAILLVSMQKWSLKRVVLILSPIITYPLFLLVISYIDIVINTHVFNPPNELLFDIAIYISIYAILYALILSKLWQWIAPKKRKATIFALIIVTFITLFISPIAINCDEVNQAEKGITIEEINYCKKYNLYHPYTTYKFTGINVEIIKFTTRGPGFTGIAVILTLIFFEAKECRRLRRKK